MAQAFVAATSSASSSAVNSLAAAWPSTTAGDVVLCCLAIGGLSTLVDPTGFTFVTNFDTATTLRTKTWRHVCDGTESGSVTASWTGTAQEGVLILAAWRGVDATTPIDVAIGVNGNSVASTTPAVAASAATDVRNCLQIIILGTFNTTSGAGTVTAPSGITKQAAASSTVSPFIGLAVFDGQAVTAPVTALPARTITLSQTSTFAGQNFGLRPQVSAQADVASGSTFTTVPGIRFGAPPVPTSGQLWPRGRP